MEINETDTLMKISIGLLTYKRTDFLLDTIKDIIKVKKYQIEIIIVNNNEDVDMFPEISFLQGVDNINLVYIWDRVNYGVANGRNKIINVSSGDIILMFDDDISINSCTIDDIIFECIKQFYEDPKLGGIAFNIKDFNTGRSNKYEIPHKNKEINLNEDFYTYLMIGAGHALNKHILTQIGGYPIDFGIYGMEEIDLSFRIIGRGYKIKFLSKVEIFHKRSPSGRHSNKDIEFLSYVNRCRISLKYLRFRYVISVVIVRGMYFLYKTKSVSLFIKALKEILFFSKKRKFCVLFDNSFYKYIKEVNGFLWW